VFPTIITFDAKKYLKWISVFDNEKLEQRRLKTGEKFSPLEDSCDC